jgi:hypothetical protein
VSTPAEEWWNLRRRADRVEAVHTLLDQYDSLHVTPQEDVCGGDLLQQFGVDQPFRRWRAVREFLAAWKARDERALHRALVRLVILLYIREEWRRTGADPWGPKQSLVDDAILWAHEHLGHERVKGKAS